MRCRFRPALVAGIVFILLNFNQAFAQAPGQLTLSQALVEAQKGSPQIGKAAAAYDEQSWKRVEAVSAFLPNLSASLNYITNKEYTLTDVNLGGPTLSIPQIVPTTQYTISSRWNLFDGFASTNRWKAARAAEQSASLEYDWSKFQTERQVVLAYYKLLAAYQVKNVANENLKALRDHNKDVDALKKAGVSTQYDVLRTEVQVSEAEAETINANDQVESARNRLAEVLGEDIEAREPVGNLPVLPADLMTKVNLKLDKKLDLQALVKKSESLEYNAQAANRHWIPKISVFADYNYYNNRNDKFQDNEAFRESYLIGANLTWALFDGFGAVAKSSQAAAQSIQLQQTLRQTQLKSKNDLDFWKRKYGYFSSLYKSKTNDIGRSNEAVRLARVGRRAGVRTNTELLDAQADVFRSQAAQISSQIGAIEALINVELATGEKLYNFN